MYLYRVGQIELRLRAWPVVQRLVFRQHHGRLVNVNLPMATANFLMACPQISMTAARSSHASQQLWRTLFNRRDAKYILPIAATAALFVLSGCQPAAVKAWRRVQDSVEADSWFAVGCGASRRGEVGVRFQVDQFRSLLK